MANLAEAIQGLVHHMRTEQQMIRDWADSQAEQNQEIRKVLALLAYIVLGSIALKRGRTRRVRLRALAGALAVLAYIFAVALTRHPLPGLAT